MARSLAARFGLPTSGGSSGFLAALFIDGLGIGLFAPFSMLYFDRVTAASIGAIGLALTAAALVTLTLTPVTGILVDRLGAQRLVVASQVLQAAGFGGYLVVRDIGTLFAGALLVTAGNRMFFASFSTLVAQVAAADERDRWYGLVGAMQALAGGLAGLVGSVLLTSGAVTVYRGVIVANIACFLAVAMLIERQRWGHLTAVGHTSEPAGYRTVLRDRPFLIFVGSNGLFALCGMILGVGFVPYATKALEMPLWLVGVTGAVDTALVVLLQTTVVRLLQPYRRTHALLAAGMIWVVVGVLLATAIALPQVALVPYLVLSLALFTLGHMIYAPISRTVAAEIGPARLQGRYVATYEFSWGVAAALGPGLFGLLYDQAHPLPWLGLASFSLLAVILVRGIEAAIPAHANGGRRDGETARRRGR